MDLSIKTAQDRPDTQPAAALSQQVSPTTDFNAFASMLLQANFRFAGSAGLPFLTQTTAANYTQPQTTSKPSQPTPAQSPAQSPAPNQAQSPSQSPAQSPAPNQAQSPSQSPIQSQAQNQAQSQNQTQSQDQNQAQSPSQNSGAPSQATISRGTSAHSHGKDPSQADASTPAALTDSNIGLPIVFPISASVPVQTTAPVLVADNAEANTTTNPGTNLSDSQKNSTGGAQNAQDNVTTAQMVLALQTNGTATNSNPMNAITSNTVPSDTAATDPRLLGIQPLSTPQTATALDPKAAVSASTTTTAGQTQTAPVADTATSIFALQLNQPTNITTPGRSTGSKIPAGADTNRTSAVATTQMSAQATALSAMLGSGDRLSLHVTAASGGTASAAQTTTSLVSNALLFAAGANNTTPGLPTTPSAALPLTMDQNSPGQTPVGPTLGGLAPVEQTPEGQTLGGLAPGELAPGQTGISAANELAGQFADASMGIKTGATPDLPPVTFAQLLHGATEVTGETSSVEQNAPTPVDGVPMPQLAGLQGSGQATALSQQTQGAGQPAASSPVQIPTPVEQIKVNVTKAVAEGANHISIQLAPEHLGRIDVQMDVGQDGKVQATVTADKPETLAMLKQDSTGLEKALQDAGLHTDPDALTFNLRGDGQQQQMASENDANRNGNGRHGQGAYGNGGGQNDQTADDGEQRRLAAQAARQRLTAQRGGLDVSI
ncbi:MAG: flagellar hook-length control protein FliK [Alphaproteobacteria bacterium]|nr:flagellar hook-length control protein FliK [Alphaproteobacteria bacterium]